MKDVVEDRAAPTLVDLVDEALSLVPRGAEPVRPRDDLSPDERRGYVERLKGTMRRRGA